MTPSAFPATPAERRPQHRRSPPRRAPRSHNAVQGRQRVVSPSVSQTPSYEESSSPVPSMRSISFTNNDSDHSLLGDSDKENSPPVSGGLRAKYEPTVTISNGRTHRIPVAAPYNRTPRVHVLQKQTRVNMAIRLYKTQRLVQTLRARLSELQQENVYLLKRLETVQQRPRRG
ncbi:hypothetical protein CVT24_004725 [Panaeolus cyanescens]|uniref:BZIP domain-containing protein n=1 Tax=Panaeolus cyanescens TaxID=181874 RepID=A0A409YSP6_9AGAR|nr:hypothetical protein CVT24_004725 [Panaeolus cyanescens]